MPPRPRLVFLIASTSIFLTLIFILFNTPLSTNFRFKLSPFQSQKKYTCPPSAYSNGTWQYAPRTNKTTMTHSDDALLFSGFEGCAASREFYWHLASDREDHWDRFPKAQSWKWVPNNEKTCRMKDFSREDMVKGLVEEGGWLVLGDSVSENHFFSLSCTLYPHVIATPYPWTSEHDRGYPQNLYLNPDSPLTETITFPKGFDIQKTPLVTFRRIDLLFSESDLENLHRSLHPDQDGEFKLFSEEAAWTLSPSYYLSNELFTRPLPDANYATLVVSTGGHWTTTLFSGYRDESKADEGYGIDGVIAFFRQAMDHWASLVQDTINSDTGVVTITGRRKRQALVRAYLPGHEDCHSHREPWKEIQPMIWGWFNWGRIWEFNQVFEEIVRNGRYPNIHYLGIDRPARLRPDAHATGDCLHIMTGAGVMEGWTEYLWHFATNEVEHFRIRGSR